MPLGKIEYLLLVLSEEAVEVSHAVHKALRFTTDESHTIGGPTNYDKLVEEFNQLLATVDALREAGFVIPLHAGIQARKKARIKDYMGISQHLGVVDQNASIR